MGTKRRVANLATCQNRVEFVDIWPMLIISQLVCATSFFLPTHHHSPYATSFPSCALASVKLLNVTLIPCMLLVIQPSVLYVFHCVCLMGILQFKGLEKLEVGCDITREFQIEVCLSLRSFGPLVSFPRLLLRLHPSTSHLLPLC